MNSFVAYSSNQIPSVGRPLKEKSPNKEQIRHNYLILFVDREMTHLVSKKELNRLELNWSHENGKRTPFHMLPSMTCHSSCCSLP
eukprot:scaffold33588_cov128-Skeletonema_dohrnii-CCMP3373.AAC.4